MAVVRDFVRRDPTRIDPAWIVGTVAAVLGLLETSPELTSGSVTFAFHST